MKCNFFDFDNNKFEAISSQQTEEINGGAVFLGVVLIMAAVGGTGLVVTPIVARDLRKAYNTGYEQGYRAEEYAYHRR